MKLTGEPVWLEKPEMSRCPFEHEVGRDRSERGIRAAGHLEVDRSILLADRHRVADADVGDGRRAGGVEVRLGEALQAELRGKMSKESE